MRGAWLGLALAALGCSTERTDSPASTSGPAHPLVAMLRARAPDALPRSTGTGSARVIPFGSPEARASLRAPVRERLSVVLEAGDRASDPFRVGLLGFELRVGVRREQARPSWLGADSGAVIYEGALASADILVTPAGDDVEELVIFDGAGGSISYELSVPDGSALRHPVADLPIIEIVGPDGNAWLRFRADRAWDGAGQIHVPRAELEGSTVTFSVPDAATPPIVLDPLWTATGSLGLRREKHTATLLLTGEVLIAGGGYRGANSYYYTASTGELFDPAGNGGLGSFTSAGNMAALPRPGGGTATGRFQHTATRLPNGDVLLVGGRWDDFCCSAENLLTAEIYSASGFAGTTSLSRQFASPVAVSLPSGSVLVSSGAQSEIYDPAGATWSNTAPPANSVGTTATRLLSGLVLTTGSGAAALYDESSDTWTSTSAPSTNGDKAARLPSGEVLLVGTSTAELFDPAAGTWTTAPSPGEARNAATLTVLSDGRALLAGGSASSSAELYASGVFSSVWSMSSRRDFHTATLLDSGAVLVAGGYDGSQSAVDRRYLTSAELFAQYALGAACSIAGECSSGYCADGVCCDTACDGECVTCIAAKRGSGIDGTCGPVDTGLDPDSECAAEPEGTCGGLGHCDGAGACAKHPAGTICVPQACNGTTVFLADACDGSGTCVDQGSADCAPYACTGGGCASSCSSEAECAPGAYCEGGSCIARLSDGSACARPGECLSGFCVDGVCCNTPCEGQCEACAESNAVGSCIPVTGAPRTPRAACDTAPAGEPCAQRTCDGIERSLCNGWAGSLVVCREAACVEGEELAEARCDGAGNCAQSEPIFCGAFACGATACKRSCSDDTDCSEGSLCDIDASRCVAATSCLDGFTVVDAFGDETSCAPYACKAGACQAVCAETAECAPGYVCDTSEGVCLAKDDTSAGDEGGCGCRQARRGQSGPEQVLWALFLLGSLAARRRTSLVGGVAAARLRSGDD